MDQPMHLVRFELDGPVFQDERGNDRRERLIDVTMMVNEYHAATIASSLLEMLSRRGAIVVPMDEKQKQAILEEFQRPVDP